MSYHVTLIETSWEIPVSSTEPIMEEIKKLASENKLFNVDTKLLMLCDYFPEFMGKFQYGINRHDENFYSIEWFYGEKLGDDEEIFRVLAKYSNPGNYVKFHGEENEVWYWTVTDKFTLEEDLIDLSEYDWRENKYEVEPYRKFEESYYPCENCFYDKCNGCRKYDKGRFDNIDCDCPCRDCEKGPEFKPFK